MSLPTRGGWIEILEAVKKSEFKKSLPTRGGWIEIMMLLAVAGSVSGPSPHGEGGLKYIPALISPRFSGSLPTRGGWIEMVLIFNLKYNNRSLPTRGGWIEILLAARFALLTVVPPHTGRVD